jgi:hypothetical protein
VNVKKKLKGTCKSLTSIGIGRLDVGRIRRKSCIGEQFGLIESKDHMCSDFEVRQHRKLRLIDKLGSLKIGTIITQLPKQQRSSRYLDLMELETIR